MKKSIFIIANIIWLLITTFFIVYAQIQTGFAEEAKKEASRWEEAANLSAEEAVRQAVIAKQNEAEALRQKQIADDLNQQLEECNK